MAEVDNPFSRTPLRPRVTVTSRPVQFSRPLPGAAPGIVAPLSAPSQKQRTLDVRAYRKPKTSRMLMKLAVLCLALYALYAAGGVAVGAIAASGKVFVGQAGGSLAARVKQLLGTAGGIISGNQKPRDMNVLLLGVGGEGHEGPYLTDTIIVAEFRPAQNTVTLASVPRDYLTNLPDGSRGKINAAFALALGKDKNWDAAGAAARRAAEQVTGLSVPYFAVVDFGGFEKAIDEVGGVDVHVDRTFTDASYPDERLGYLPPVTFREGDEHMDGKRALVFARSRHGNNGEGSDLARSARQHKVVEALRTRALSLGILADPTKLTGLLSIFADHFHTNVPPQDLLALAGKFRDGGTSIRGADIDLDGGLICPQIIEETGAYVLVPCPGRGIADVRRFFELAPAIAAAGAEKPTVWLSAPPGTSRKRDAERVLKDAHIPYFELPYDASSTATSVMYQVSPKPGTAAYLKGALDLTEVTLPPPGVKVSPEKVDVIIVIGPEAKPDGSVPGAEVVR